MVVGGEIIARILVDRLYVLDEMNLTYRYDEELGWFPIENSSKQFKGTRLINVYHNVNGFRDIDHGPKSKKRIAFLGDSFVWGYDVEYGERFTEYLQQRLPDWEMINMGISGYNTDQELLLIQKWFDYFNPDIVFLVFCDENDWIGNSSNMMHRYYKPYYTYTENKLVKHGTPVSKSLPYYTAKYPNLLKSRLVQGIIQITMPKRIFIDNPTIEIILEMNAFVQSKGGRFFLAFTDDFGKGEECSFCESNNIPYLLLTNNLRYDKNGYHWTPEGNEFVSNKIYEFLRLENILTD